MNPEEFTAKPSFQAQFSTVLKPKNLVKTVASQIPFVSATVEMINQVEGEDVNRRLQELKESDVKLHSKIENLMEGTKKPVFDVNDWSIAASAYVARIVDLLVVYDGEVESPAKRGRELVLRAGHGCFTGESEVLTCGESLDIARGVAAHKNGRVVIQSAFAWYDFDAQEVDEASGLLLCRIKNRDEEKYARFKKLYNDNELSMLWYDPDNTPIKYSRSPLLGQEIGFLHTGEAEDIFPFGLTPFQFDNSVISHFRRTMQLPIKTFASGVLPGRVKYSGSPVFSRDATLLGIIAATENYASDAGRRIIIKSLLGHPRFTKFKNNK